MTASTCVPMLLSWWLHRLRFDSMRGLRQWHREPEWPLLFVGAVLFVSFLFHWLGYRLAVHQIGWPSPLFEPTEWEGRTGWRKPLVFGVSNAMLFVSLRQALSAQQLVPRAFTSHLAAWSTALEVGIITLQAWRGVPSHFNTSTPLDATLYIVKLAGVLLLSTACILATLGVFLRPLRTVAASQLIALRHGLLLLCLSIVVAVIMVVVGHLPHAPREDEMAPCLVATAGAVGSPCYEIHGQAIVKLAHFLPLHITEVLLLLAWATRYTPHSRGTYLIHIAAAGSWLLNIVGLWTVWVGENIKAPSSQTAVAIWMSLAPIFGSFIWVFLSPLSNGLKV
eukprot:gnl/TRDRNA2_/TRDRNA2_200024_c0_seq1.p1 gnl/TRDRNA2_/TRDRNA2_200024_c0~~gnl/TRDRNA2_/TRDRNA2_200024_c0_seq1.p1  ORF type:complete len:360 (+),score=34.52 gnl/TRDRNA2_/TRDRNA2_200024_c0_seq1:71-1081(+)